VVPFFCFSEGGSYTSKEQTGCIWRRKREEGRRIAQDPGSGSAALGSGRGVAAGVRLRRQREALLRTCRAQLPAQTPHRRGAHKRIGTRQCADRASWAAARCRRIRQRTGTSGAMRHPGLVAAAIAAATALSSKQGRELLESKLQPLYMPAAYSEGDDSEVRVPTASRRAQR